VASDEWRAGPPTPGVIASVDSKRFADEFSASVDSAGLRERNEEVRKGGRTETNEIIAGDNTRRSAIGGFMDMMSNRRWG
jgi:hypothetical protein